MADAVQFEFTAQISQLLEALQSAQSSMEDAFSSMETKIDEVSGKLDSTFKSAAGDAGEGLRNLGESAEGSQAGVESLAGKMDTMFSAIKIGVAVEAVRKLFEELGEAGEQATHVEQMASAVGATTTEYQGLQAAAAQAGVPMDMMDRALMRLTMQMQAATPENQQLRDKLAAVGITAADLADPTFTAASALERMAASGAKPAAMMEVLDRRTFMVTQAFKYMQDGQAGVEAQAESLGALTEQQIATLHEYHATIETAALKWEYFKDAILAGVAPAVGNLVTALEQLFGVMNTGERTSDDFRSAVTGIEMELLKWAAAAKQLSLDLGHVFDTIGFSLGNVGAVIAAAAHGDFTRAKEIWKEGTADLERIDKEYADNIIANQNKLSDALYSASLKSAKSVQIDQLEEPRPQTGGQAQDYKEEVAEAKAAAQEEMQAQVDAVAKELDAVHAAAKQKTIDSGQEYEETLGLIERKLAAQLNYYDKLKTLHGTTTAQIMELDRQEAHAKADADLEEQQAEEKKVEAQKAAEKEANQAIVESAKAALNQKLAMLKQEEDATKSQEKQTSVFDIHGPQEELAATLAIIAQEKAAYDDYYNHLREQANLSAEQLKKINDEEAQHEIQLRSKVQQAWEKEESQIKQQWQGMVSMMTSAFSSNIEQMLRHQETFGQGMLKIWGDIVNSAINKMVQMTVNWVAQQIEQRVVSQSNSTTEVGQKEAQAAILKGIDTQVSSAATLAQSQITSSTLANAATQVGAVKAAAEGEVASYAGVAGAAGVASAAAIPVTGWAMAPAAGAADYGAAMAYGQFATGSWEVPEDMTAGIHAGEMIIPAAQAQGVRSAAGAGANFDSLSDMFASGGGEAANDAGRGYVVPAGLSRSFTGTADATEGLDSGATTTGAGRGATSNTSIGDTHVNMTVHNARTNQDLAKEVHRAIRNFHPAFMSMKRRTRPI